MTYIRRLLKIDYSNLQKRDADKRMRSLEFLGMIRFFRKFRQPKYKEVELLAKLRPRSVGPDKFIERLNPIACRLDLPMWPIHVHNVSRISQPRKCIPDVDHAIVSKTIEVTRDLMYEEH